jgi:hypothetical protein
MFQLFQRFLWSPRYQALREEVMYGFVERIGTVYRASVSTLICHSRYPRVSLDGSRFVSPILLGLAHLKLCLVRHLSHPCSKVIGKIALPRKLVQRHSLFSVKDDTYTTELYEKRMDLSVVDFLHDRPNPPRLLVRSQWLRELGPDSSLMTLPDCGGAERGAGISPPRGDRCPLVLPTVYVDDLGAFGG